jgi:hypothetical protein
MNAVEALASHCLYLQQSQASQPDLQQAAALSWQQPQHAPANRGTLAISSVANNPTVIIIFFIAILLFLKSGIGLKIVLTAVPGLKSEERETTGRNRMRRPAAAAR